MNMKKLLASLLLIAVLVSSIAAMAATVQFKTGAKVYKTKSTKTCIATVKKGSVAEVVGKFKTTQTWTQIRLSDDSTAYVKTSNLKDAKDAEPSIVYSSGGNKRSSVMSTGDPYKTGMKYVKVLKGSRVNIRTTPSLDGKSLGVMKDGDKKTQKLKYLGMRAIDSRKVYFYKVEYKGKEAWVSSMYTELKK